MRALITNLERDDMNASQRRAHLDKTQILVLVDIVRREQKHAPCSDERRRVNYVLAEYRGVDGESYRKAFRSYSEPIVPTQGTHGELNALAEQW